MSNSATVERSNIAVYRKKTGIKKKNAALRKRAPSVSGNTLVPKFWHKSNMLINHLYKFGFFEFLKNETVGDIRDPNGNYNELMIIKKNNSNVIATETLFIPKGMHKTFAKQMRRIERKLKIEVSFSRVYCNCGGVEKNGWYEARDRACDATCAHCLEIKAFAAGENSGSVTSIYRKHIDDFIYIVKRWPGRVRWEWQ